MFALPLLAFYMNIKHIKFIHLFLNKYSDDKNSLPSIVLCNQKDFVRLVAEK